MFQFNRLVAITVIACTSVNTLYANNSANVFAWGANGNGQCNVPSELGASPAVAAGSYHSLAIQARTGTVWAWETIRGDNQMSLQTSDHALPCQAAADIH